MYKFLFIALSLSLFKCERPIPQKPKVISTVSYVDTLYHDSIVKVNIKSNDSIKIDSTKTEKSALISASDTINTIEYSNYAKQNLRVKYENFDEINYALIIFSEKNLKIKLKETDSESNIYKGDSVKWETRYKRRAGKLTINGTWFDFLIVE